MLLRADREYHLDVQMLVYAEVSSGLRSNKSKGKHSEGFLHLKYTYLSDRRQLHFECELRAW